MAINLIKGQKISLAKDDGERLQSFCVGANWGAITEKGFFRDKIKPVDLDLSAAILINSFAISSISVKNQPQAYFTAATISWAISEATTGWTMK